MYRFFPRKLPTPGFERYAFAPEFTLPLQRATGTATPTMGALMVTAPAIPVPYRNTIAGVGGVISGQIVQQPLITSG